MGHLLSSSTPRHSQAQYRPRVHVMRICHTDDQIKRLSFWNRTAEVRSLMGSVKNSLWLYKRPSSDPYCVASSDPLYYFDSSATSAKVLIDPDRLRTGLVSVSASASSSLSFTSETFPSTTSLSRLFVFSILLLRVLGLVEVVPRLD